MYELALDTDTQKLNKKHGYNNTVAVIKEVEFDGFALIMIFRNELEYFRNGRAHMHTKRSYDVVISAKDTRATSFDRFWFDSKAEATKYFNSLKKQFKGENK